MIYPSKLKSGDTIRVVSLSGPIEWAKPDKLAKAEQFFESRGVTVTYAQHMGGNGPLNVVPIRQRVIEFEKALADPTVNAVWVLSGGDNANQVLPYLDTKLFKSANKIFIGHSDNTVLLNALSTTTGVVTYYGPNFHALGSAKGSRTTYEFVDKAIFSDEAYSLRPVRTWHDKDYSTNPPKTHSHNDTVGWWPINTLNGAGELVVGEISTLALLQGTKFFPNLKNKILALEMFAGNLAHFDRLLESLLLQKGADKLEGLILGRFQSAANISREDVAYVLQAKDKLQAIPVIANVDFGHTTPRMTMPIGGHVQLQVKNKNSVIRIGEH